jgi:hypothetical protein
MLKQEFGNVEFCDFTVALLKISIPLIASLLGIAILIILPMQKNLISFPRMRLCY